MSLSRKNALTQRTEDTSLASNPAASGMDGHGGQRLKPCRIVILEVSEGLNIAIHTLTETLSIFSFECLANNCSSLDGDVL